MDRDNHIVKRIHTRNWWNVERNRLFAKFLRSSQYVEQYLNRMDDNERYKFRRAQNLFHRRLSEETTRVEELFDDPDPTQAYFVMQNAIGNLKGSLEAFERSVKILMD